jgi:hypothetical protein
MLLAIWSIERLLRHARSGRIVDLAASALLLALAALTKIEAATAALLAHGAFVVARLTGIGTLPSVAWGIYGGALALVAAGYGIALRDRSGRAPPRELPRRPRPSGMRTFVRHYAGADDVVAGVWRLAESALALAVAVAGSLALGTLAQRKRVNVRLAAGFGVGLGILAYVRLGPAAVVRRAAARWDRRRRHADRPDRRSCGIAPRGAPLDGGARLPRPHAPRGGRPPLRVLPAPASLAAFVVWWFRTLPAWLGNAGPAVTHCAVGVALLLTTAASHWRVSVPMFGAHTVRVDAPRGSTWLLAEINGFPLGRALCRHDRRTSRPIRPRRAC